MALPYSYIMVQNQLFVPSEFKEVVTAAYGLVYARIAKVVKLYWWSSAANANALWWEWALSSHQYYSIYPSGGSFVSRRAYPADIVLAIPALRLM